MGYINQWDFQDPMNNVRTLVPEKFGHIFCREIPDERFLPLIDGPGTSIIIVPGFPIHPGSW